MLKIRECAQAIRAKKSKIAVFGVCNIDILVKAREQSSRLCDPARIKLCMGGVGRNIAVASAYLGCEVDFFTALDVNSVWGDLFERELSRENVNVNCLLNFNNAFCAIEKNTDEIDQSCNKGDKGLDKGYYDDGGKNDWSDLLLRWQQSNLEHCEYDAIVVESALLRGDAGGEFCSNFYKLGIKVALVGTATDRVGAFDEMFKGVYLLQLNNTETQGLLLDEGMARNSCEQLVHKINKRGVENVLLSRGERGVFCGNEAGVCLVVGEDLEEKERKSVLGAGDSLFSGVLSALLAGLPFSAAVGFGVYCAECACRTEEMVSVDLKNIICK